MKSNKQPGYLIIELLVYCSLIAGVILITLEWSVAQYLNNSKREKDQEILTQLHITQCVLVRDIQRSITTLNQWKKHSPNDYIWSVEDGDVGWQVSDQQLIRIQGNYNQDTHTWHTRSKGLSAHGVLTLDITPSNSSCIVCQLTSVNQDTCARNVCIRNGVLI